MENFEKVNSNGVLAVGDPEKTRFSLFSDRANTLVILKDGLCEERSYKTANGMNTRTSSILDDVVCEEIKGKINKAFGKSEKGNSMDNV